ncbi:MAG: pimeloyl-ACP methyl ester esterase BioH [Candidatus Sedimenticola sp. (ex Thyasira tokunagai)]
MKLSTETDGTGPDLVFLHGWGMNGAVWSSLITPLAKRFRITVIELPGHGASEYDEYLPHFDDWVEACLEVAPDSATWVGWSLGGQLAQRAAMKAPDRVERLILFTSSPRFVQGEAWDHAMERAVLKLFAKALVKDHAQTLGRFLSLQVQGDDGARETLRALRSDIAARPEPNPQALEHGLDMLLTVDLRDQLPSITCQVLWLLSERDTLVPAAVAGDIRSLMPGAEIEVIPGAAHAPFLSHPEACLKAFDHFLGTSDD